MLTMVVGLVVANIAVQFSRHHLGHERLLGLVRLFDLDAEGNIPTWYASMTLLAAGMCFGVIWWSRRRAQDRFARHWLGLTLLFTMMSIDESAQMHELLITPVRGALNTGGILYYAWVIPGAAFVLALCVLYWKFLRALPTRTARQMVLAGCIYFGGAIGIELIGGWYMDRANDSEDFTYSLITTVEETLEMIGVVVLIHALLSYIQQQNIIATLCDSAAAHEN